MNVAELLEIGNHILGRVTRSGMFSFANVVYQSSHILLTLESEHFTFSPRIVRFCLNFLGGQKHLAEKSEVFMWCSAFVEEVTSHRCRIWIKNEQPCGYTGFDIICELIFLAARLSSQSVPQMKCSYSYATEDLMKIYRTKEEVLAFYESFVISVIQSGADEPTLTCDGTLRDLWLCCPTHRFLFVQRLMLNSWLHHILGDSNPDNNTYRKYLKDAPSLVYMRELIAHLLHLSLGPQEWLEVCLLHRHEIEEKDWNRATRLCEKKHHLSLACCSFHVALTVFSYLHQMWLEHFDGIYHLSEMVDECGFYWGKCNASGIALLIHLAKLDARNVAFTSLYEEVARIDVSLYRRNPSGAR